MRGRGEAGVRRAGCTAVACGVAKVRREVYRGLKRGGCTRTMGIESASTAKAEAKGTARGATAHRVGRLGRGDGGDREGGQQGGGGG